HHISDPGAPMSVDISYNPRTGTAVGSVEHTTPETLRAVLAQAADAAAALAQTAPRQRQAWIDSVADTLEAHVGELAELADTETALGLDRLTGEVARAASQLRFYASVAVEGSYLRATITPASP